MVDRRPLLRSALRSGLRRWAPGELAAITATLGSILMEKGPLCLPTPEYSNPSDRIVLDDSNFALSQT